MGLAGQGLAQNTFQRLYIPPGTGAHCLGSLQLEDGDFLFTGIVSDGSDKVYMTKTDCEGEVLWSKSYNASSTIGNVSPRAVELDSGGYVLAASIGQYGSYNILVVKVDEDGTTLWQKVMQGGGDDVVNKVIEARNGDIVIAGHTNSFGQDAGSPYTDIYIARISADGSYLWGKAIGTDNNIDGAFDVIETADSNLVATGRCIEQGTFYAFLLKMDPAGMPQFMQAYGDTNQYSSGYGLIDAPGGFALAGSTTVMKNSFQDYPDVFLIRTDATGDTIWTRTYHGTNSDGSENASSLVRMFSDGGYTVAVASMSYPTVGFVPNKHVLLRTDANGNMTAVKSYNNGGSHYPYITKPKGNEGVLLSGFTTNYPPGQNNTFKPLIILTDEDLNSGCNETDRLAQTVQEQPPFQVRTPAYVVASGGSLISSSVSADVVWGDTLLCANIVEPCSTAGVADVESATGLRYDAWNNTVFAVSPLPGPGLLVVYDAFGRMVAEGPSTRPLALPADHSNGVYIAVLIQEGRRIPLRFLKAAP